MARLVRTGAVVVHWSEERSERRQGDSVIGRAVERAVSLMQHLGRNSAKERLSVLYTQFYGCLRVGFRAVSVHLANVEHAVPAREEKARISGLLVVFTILTFDCTLCKLPERDAGCAFATSYLAAPVLPLLIRAPFAAFIALLLRCRPQAKRIHTTVRFLTGDVNRREGIPA